MPLHAENTGSNVKGAPLGFTPDRIEQLLSLVPAPAERTSSRIGWVERRLRERDAVIAFLKAQCILVTLRDREAPVATYWVTGKRYTHTQEELLQLAQAMGFEVSHGR